MITRRWIGFFFALLGISASHAAPPASAAQKLFHTSYITSSRAAVNSYLLLDKDGGFTYLLYQRGNVLDLPWGPAYQIGYRQPRAGTYTYTLTAPDQATLLVTNGDGTVDRFTLHFQDDRSGACDVISGSGGGGNASRPTFELIDPAEYRSAPLVNTALRGYVGAGQSLIAGFVISGQARTVLIRAVGPGLIPLGVSRAWTDPDFQLYQGSTPLNLKTFGYRFTHYGDWSADGVGQLAGSTASAFSALFSFLGAFPLTANSKDAAEVTELAPGAYTVVCTPPPSDAGGEVLIEIYTLP